MNIIKHQKHKNSAKPRMTWMKLDENEKNIAQSVFDEVIKE